MPGPVTVSAEIGGQPYRLVFKFGSFGFFEDATGHNVQNAFPFFTEEDKIKREELASAVKWSTWGALFWAVLQPDHRITRDEANNMIDQAGFDQVVSWCIAGIAGYMAADQQVVEALLTEIAEGKASRSAKEPPPAKEQAAAKKAK